MLRLEKEKHENRDQNEIAKSKRLPSRPAPRDCRAGESGYAWDFKRADRMTEMIEALVKLFA